MRKQSDIELLHTLLRKEHVNTRGPVLAGDIVHSRIFEHRDRDILIVWGADYEPVSRITGRLVVPLFCRWRDDLGLPAAVPQDGWLSRAEATDNGTQITQFQYTTGAWRGLGPSILSVRSGHVRRSPAELDARTLHAGVEVSPPIEACMEPARPLAAKDTEQLICLLARIHEAVLLPSMVEQSATAS